MPTQDRKPNLDLILSTLDSITTRLDSITTLTDEFATDASQARNGAAAAISKVAQTWEKVSALDRRVADLERIVIDIVVPSVARFDAMLGEAESMNQGLILNVSQVAKSLGVSRPTVYRLIESGALPAKKLSTGSDTAARTVVLSEDLKRFLSELPSADEAPKESA